MNNGKGKLDGKVVLITGAASGIGQASAILFAREGAKVIVCDINENLGRKTTEELKAQGGKALFIKTDVSSSSDVKELIHLCTEQYGALDILFNCAAISRLGEDGPVSEVSEEVWHATIAVNLTGTFLCCKYAIPLMVQNKRGSIINVSSIAAMTASNNHAYSASKGGVITLTRSIAVSYAPYNIRANVICPGRIETPMTQWIRKDPKRLEAYLSKEPLRRLAQPVEVARMALYLASDESPHVTGAILPIDGGMAAV